MRWRSGKATGGYPASADAGHPNVPEILTGRSGLHDGVTKVGGRVTNRVVRQRLLEAAGAALGVDSSVDGGIVRELIVWVVEDKAS